MRKYILLVTILAVITHWRWIFLNSFFGWGDAQFLTRFDQTWQGYIGLPSSWTTLINGMGEVDLVLSQHPIYFTYGMLTRLGLDTRLAAKFIFFAPIIFAAPLGSFALIRHFTRNDLSAFVGSLVYSYNVNFLMSQTGSLSLSAAYSLAPLSFFTFIAAIKKQKLKVSFIAGLALFFTAMHEFRIFYIVAFVLFFYFLYHLVSTPIRSKSRLFLTAALPFIVLAVLSSYWLLPFIISGSLQSNQAFSRPLFGDQYMSLKQSIAFFSPWWTGGRGYANGVVQPIPNYFWAIPVLAFLGFVLNIKKPKVYFFLFLSLLGILLTKQSDKPFPNLYLWLYQHFPGFNAYREASKFFVILSLGYSGLIAYFIFALRSHKRALIIASIFVSILFLRNTLPLVTGKIAGIFIPKNRPQDYDIVKDFIHRQPDFFRTAWFPAAGIWGYYDALHPKIDLHTVYFNTLGPYILKQPGFRPAVNTSGLIDKINHQALNLFTQNFSDQLLDSLSIKYVIIPSKDTTSDNDVFVNYGLPDRDYILNFFDGMKYLKRVDIGTNKIALYENSGFKPLIYTKSGPVKYMGSSATGYKISMAGIKFPTYLNFTDANHPGWILSSGTRQEADSLTNSFYIKNSPRQSTILLAFSSQKYVYYGLAISLGALAIICSAILLSP